ncbi:carbon starvation protein A [Nocardiopsis sp. HNM0947]|uniref:Carbon starvation protein A n=1 Tax=Nocardiopsis coralli TaxID=2772213 RepID=A0ABR9P1E7_9ACTN|nr:carbon starvation protein A [Nocardiopsis coralli]MBE2997664.1 carbon starvation protein A [Nocardiopsis coralli]
MPAAAVLLGTLALFALGYRFYSVYLAKRVYALEPSFVTPAHAYNDGVDFVPTNKHIVLAHHFISVAGAAPIVGPAIAVFWGWGPALLWVVLGTIFAAGAHDFGSIAVSVRHKGRSIGTLAGDVISRRARVLFLLIIFFLVTMVNAVFAIVVAGLLEQHPAAVLPTAVTLPLAIAVGQIVYRKRTAALIPSLIALVTLYACIPLGQLMPITLDPVAEATGISSTVLWILILFLYAYIASRLPVWMLLQPRDYINQHQLVVALVVIAAGVLVGMNTIAAPAFRDVPADSPSIFPLLFVTIACGAVSGFHSLVASGTTSKQIDKETDSRYVGYMAALGEGSLALASILACTAGVMLFSGNQGIEWSSLYATWGDAGADPQGMFVDGVAGFASNLGIPESTAQVFGALIIVSFAVTTLDTAVRLKRYILQEMSLLAASRFESGSSANRAFRGFSRNLSLTTLVAVALPFGLAMVPGDFALGTLWVLFGTTNQLTAGLALAVIAVWVAKRGRNPIVVVIPLVFLLFMTVWALIEQLIGFLDTGSALDMFLLAPLDTIILVLALWMIVEAFVALRDTFRGTADPIDPSSETDQVVAEGGTVVGGRKDGQDRDEAAVKDRPEEEK